MNRRRPDNQPSREALGGNPGETHWSPADRIAELEARLEAAQKRIEWLEGGMFRATREWGGYHHAGNCPRFFKKNVKVDCVCGYSDWLAREPGFQP